MLNNPADHGYPGTPEEVCHKLRDEWIENSKTRRGAWAYCISSDGLHHVHMVLEDGKSMRFSAIKKAYAAGMHFEATKGNKQQAEDYIHKRPPFDEKGETVEHICFAGEIKGVQGKRSDLQQIAALIDEGKTPQEIMDENFSYRRYERMIRSAFFAKRRKETPVHRDVEVHFLIGDSGSGKSYTYVTLCEDYGEHEIYFLSDYETGGLDQYQGEQILFMDEYKGQYPFSFLLVMLDRYKAQIHARFSNVYALWAEVYITSVFPPEELYKKMVQETDRGIDKQQQLMRRISDITYCFVDDNGEYRRYTIPMSKYKGYEDLKKQAVASIVPIQSSPPDGFIEIEDDGDLPF